MSTTNRDRQGGHKRDIAKGIIFLLITTLETLLMKRKPETSYCKGNEKEIIILREDYSK